MQQTLQDATRKHIVALAVITIKSGVLNNKNIYSNLEPITMSSIRDRSMLKQENVLFITPL